VLPSRGRSGSAFYAVFEWVRAKLRIQYTLPVSGQAAAVPRRRPCTVQPKLDAASAALQGSRPAHQSASIRLTGSLDVRQSSCPENSCAFRKRSGPATER
jgi:hypothetical protein